MTGMRSYMVSRRTQVPKDDQKCFSCIVSSFNHPVLDSTNENEVRGMCEARDVSSACFLPGLNIFRKPLNLFTIYSVYSFNKKYVEHCVNFEAMEQ